MGWVYRWIFPRKCEITDLFAVGLLVDQLLMAEGCSSSRYRMCIPKIYKNQKTWFEAFNMFQWLILIAATLRPGWYTIGFQTTCTQPSGEFFRAMAEPAITSADRVGLLKVFQWQNDWEEVEQMINTSHIIYINVPTIIMMLLYLLFFMVISYHCRALRPRLSMPTSWRRRILLPIAGHSWRSVQVSEKRMPQ